MFDDLVNQMDRIAVSTFGGDSIQYHKFGGATVVVENGAIRDDDIEVLADGGSIIANSTVYHLPNEFIGIATRGDVVEEAGGDRWAVSRVLENDGFMTSVLVTPDAP